jgi:type I restriction enzyme S subunit
VTPDLPPNWVLTTVGHAGEVRVGRQRSPAKTSGRKPTKYLRAANIGGTGLDLTEVLQMDFSAEELATYQLRHGDVVLAEASGSAHHVGRSAVWRDEIPVCCFQNTVIRFRPIACIADYAACVFRHYAAAGVFARAARGIGIQHLGASRFAHLDFPLPPLNEQQRIAQEVARRIGELKQAESALRDASRRIAEQRKAILAAAIGAHLVETDAAIAAREGGSSAMPAHVAATPPEEARARRFDASTGWAWLRVDEAGDVQLGKKLKPTEHRGPNMRPYLRVANVLEDALELSDVKSMQFDPGEIATFELRHGDILLNEGQSPEWVGRPAMYRGEIDGACFQMTLLRFRANACVEPDFALLVFLHYLHEGEFKQVSKWSTNIAHLTRKRFVEMPFPVPPIGEQRRIVTEARRRLDDCSAQEVAVRASLARIPTMESEVLAAAVAGTLVPQDPADSPAPLPAQPRSTPSRTGRRARARASGAHRPAPSSPTTPPDGRPLALDLGNLLSVARRPMATVELFQHAGLDPNLTDDIETFYLALRAQLETKIRLSADDDERFTVEAL